MLVTQQSQLLVVVSRGCLKIFKLIISRIQGYLLVKIAL